MSMDNLLAGDSSLMDRDQDLPLLALPLLPLPDHFGLLQDTALGPSSVSVVGLSQLDTSTPVVPTSGDLSREGPFDVHGATYRGRATPPSPVSGVRWGARVGKTVDTSHRTLGTNDGAGGGSDGGPAAPA